MAPAGIILGLLLYAGVCYFTVKLLVLPALPFAIVFGAAAGVLLVAVVVAATLLRVGRFAAATVGPGEAQARLPKTATPYGRDPAWANYLFLQSRDDMRVAVAGAAGLVGVMWARPTMWVIDAPWVLWGWPLLLLPGAFLTAMTAAALVAGAVVFVLFLVVIGLACLGLLVIARVLRGVDGGIRRLRKAKATCHRPDCVHRGNLPAYRCRCGAVHHDIRAGRQGVFVRRCRCDRPLPTTVLKAASGLVAVCQDCGSELRAGAGVLTDVLVPVFGPTSAGKTRLIMAGIVALARHQRATGATFQPIGEESEATFAQAGAAVKTAQQTAKTASDRPPTGITMRLGTARRQAHLQLFDAAGEFFASREQNQELRFLSDSEGFVFVLDPFSIPAVRDDLGGAHVPRLEEAQPALMEPEPAYLVTVHWLRDQGVNLARKPLAVAVVKADVLLGLPPGSELTADTGSAALADWLRSKGLDNLLDGAERDFGEVRYFLVSSLTDVTDRDHRATRTSPGRPLLWILDKSGAGVAAKEPATP